MKTDLINDYERLVYSIIRKYSCGQDLDDLYQVGVIGLLKASENFDCSFNTKFSSYAHQYITGEVLKYIRENKVIKINKDMIKLYKSISKAKEILSQKLMREATNEEVALFLEMDVSQIDEACQASLYVKSLDYELNDEGKELNLYDSIKYEELGYNEEIMDLRREIENLPEEEQRLIISRYYQQKSQTETSKELGISQVQVSRYENKILTKLKNKLVS